jgi:hypothetical protein
MIVSSDVIVSWRIDLRCLVAGARQQPRERRLVHVIGEKLSMCIAKDDGRAARVRPADVVT